MVEVVNSAVVEGTVVDLAGMGIVETYAVAVEHTVDAVAAFAVVASGPY